MQRCGVELAATVAVFEDSKSMPFPRSGLTDNATWGNLVSRPPGTSFQLGHEGDDSLPAAAQRLFRGFIAGHQLMRRRISSKSLAAA
jgi:hypothetical protein